MKLLLDTLVWLWALTEPERLVEPVRELLAEDRLAAYLSTASAWEIAIKYRLGRLPLPESPGTFVPGRLVRDGILALPVMLAHALQVAELPDHHRDPFDRILVAQAQIEDLTLVTADPQLDAYDVKLLPATR